MAEPNDSSLAFFTKGTPRQWQFVYELRKDVIRVKADQRSSKKGGPEEFIKLDTWFREKLPKLIHSRKDPHVIYEELVQIAKWRLMMGKYRPKMLDLVRINTETSVLNISRKALKKLSAQKNLQQAITQLVNLKGIGPSTASAILAAAYPGEAPFMSDEGMLSTPGVEATDSTIAEYNNYSEQLRNKSQSLRELDPDYEWTPHKVDQALWIYYLARDLKPQLLESLPLPDEKVAVSGSRVSTTAGVEHADDNAVGAHEDLLPHPTNNHHGSHLPDEATSTCSSDKNLNSNGAFDDNSFASVPYSEEEDLSQGASCSSLVNTNTAVEVVSLDPMVAGGQAPDTTAADPSLGQLFPLDSHDSNPILNSSTNQLELGHLEPQLLLADSVSCTALHSMPHAPITPTTPTTTTDHSVAALLTNGRANGTDNCASNDVVTTSSNSSSGVLTGPEDEEDSKEAFTDGALADDSQDSLGAFAASTTAPNHHHLDSGEAVPVSLSLSNAGTEENSTDMAISTTTTNGTNHSLEPDQDDLDSQPPLKKQKTQLDMCSPLAASVDAEL